jgi:hypothetical protein
MTPEEINQKIEELWTEINKLKAASTIPNNVDNAFRERFKLNSFLNLNSSSKTVASVTQTVHESGSASYDVMKVPVGFKQASIGGTTIYIPYY